VPPCVEQTRDAKRDSCTNRDRTRPSGGRGERSALASGAKSELVCLLESADTRNAKDDALVSLSLGQFRRARRSAKRHIGFSMYYSALARPRKLKSSPDVHRSFGVCDQERTINRRRGWPERAIRTARAARRRYGRRGNGNPFAGDGRGGVLNRRSVAVGGPPWKNATSETAFLSSTFARERGRSLLLRGIKRRHFPARLAILSTKILPRASLSGNTFGERIHLSLSLSLSVISRIDWQRKAERRRSKLQTFRDIPLVRSRSRARASRARVAVV